MYNMNSKHYLNVVVDSVVGFGNYEGIFNDKLYREIAYQIKDKYSKGIKLGYTLDLRRIVDAVIDKESPIVKHLVYGDYVYGESDRKWCVKESSVIIANELQRCLGKKLQLQYEVIDGKKIKFWIQ